MVANAGELEDDRGIDGSSGNDDFFLRRDSVQSRWRCISLSLRRKNRVHLYLLHLWQTGQSGTKEDL